MFLRGSEVKMHKNDNLHGLKYMDKLYSMEKMSKQLSHTPVKQTILGTQFSCFFFASGSCQYRHMPDIRKLYPRITDSFKHQK